MRVRESGGLLLTRVFLKAHVPAMCEATTTGECEMNARSPIDLGKATLETRKPVGVLADNPYQAFGRRP